MLKLKLQYFAHLMQTADSLEKPPDAGKDWGQEEKRVSEDEMVGWHHRCNGHELGQTLGDGEGQRGLACCSTWGHKELDTAGWLNNNNLHCITIPTFLLSMDITPFSFFQLSLQKLATWQWTFSYLSMGVDVQEFLEGRVFLWWGYWYPGWVPSSWPLTDSAGCWVPLVLSHTKCL